MDYAERGPMLSAVNLCCNAAELCQVQKLVDVTALTRRLFSACLNQSSTGGLGRKGVTCFSAVNVC